MSHGEVGRQPGNNICVYWTSSAARQEFGQNAIGNMAMRAVLFVLIVAVVIFLGAVATGFLNISQTQETEAPQVSATLNGVSARGGQAPAFDVETGSVKVGTRETVVKTPTLEMHKAGDQGVPGATNNNAM